MPYDSPPQASKPFPVVDKDRELREAFARIDAEVGRSKVRLPPLVVEGEDVFDMGVAAMRRELGTWSV